jgi:ABC-2 type transport system ATP-binding protein
VLVDRLAVRLGDRVVVDGVDLDAQGGIVTVLGPNGSGKSTLLRCLATVLAPTDGSVRIDGLDPSVEQQRIEVRRRLGYLPQDVAFGDDATVFDTVDYLAVTKRIDDDRRRRRAVIEVIDRVGLHEQIGSRLGTLSVGMRRRVGLAQSLLGGPSLLVLDEPGASLDPEERLRLREILGERRTTTTIVVATHLGDEAATSDVVVVLDDGKVTFTGSPAELASIAAGCTWVQDDLPPPDVVASWRLPDGRFRCLGVAPPGAEMLSPSVEDGYLVVRHRR